MACLCSSSSKTQPCVNMTHLFVTFVVTLCSLLSSHSAAGAQVALLALPGSSVTAALPVLQTPVVLHGSGPGFTRGTPTSSAAALLQHFRTATKVSISSHVLLVQGTCVCLILVSPYTARAMALTTPRCYRALVFPLCVRWTCVWLWRLHTGPNWRLHSMLLCGCGNIRPACCASASAGCATTRHT